MSMYSFKEGNLHCFWDDCLVGKEVVVADSLDSLYTKLEMDVVPIDKVKPGFCPAYPFIDCERGAGWKFAYIYEPATNRPDDNVLKQAFLQGHIVVRRYRDEKWEIMRSTSYFDLPGYEYKLISDLPSSNTKQRVSNKTLAMWLAEGNGLLLDVRLNYVNTTYTFPADNMDCEVLDGYKVMPIGGSEWLEPTTDVCVVKEFNYG